MNSNNLGLSRIKLLRFVLAAAMLFVLACSRSPEQRTARFLESGKQHFQNKDYARAILQFQNASQSSPRNPEPYYQMALAYEAAGDLRSAVSNFRKATELNPKHVGAQLKLAELMATRGTTADLKQDAEQRAKAVLSDSPDNAEALRVLALAELGLGKLQDAESYLKQSLDKYPDNLKASVALARIEIGQKDLKAAEQTLQDAVVRSPGKAEPLILMGSFYAMTNRSEEADKAYRKALALDPSNSSAVVGMADLQDRTGQKKAAEQTLQRLSTSADARYRALYGIYLFVNGMYDAAITEFEKQAQTAPEDRAARSRLVEAYLKRGRTSDAERILAAALKANSKDIDASLQRSAIYLMRAKYADAEADLDRVIRYRPESAQAHNLKAMIYRARGEAGQEKQELTEALKRDQNLLESRLQLARLFLGENNPRAALDLLNGAPQAQKSATDLIIQRNWALLALNADDEVRESVSEALITSGIPDVLLQDALLRMRRQDYRGARSSLETALAKAPEDIRCLNALASTYIAQKKIGLALDAVLKHAARYANSAKLQVYAGQALAAANRSAEARHAFEAAKAADPKDATADFEIAKLDMKEGKLDSARSGFLRLAALPGSTAVQAHMQLGVLDYAKGNNVGALDDFRKAAEMRPHDAAILNNVAYMLAEQNQADEALPYAQQAKELAPNNPAYSDTLGWVMYRKGLYSSAIEQFESAVSKGGSAVSRYHLAMAYIQTGNLDRGLQNLREAVKINPTLPEAAAAQSLWDEAAKKARP